MLAPGPDNGVYVANSHSFIGAEEPRLSRVKHDWRRPWLQTASLADAIKDPRSRLQNIRHHTFRVLLVPRRAAVTWSHSAVCRWRSDLHSDPPSVHLTGQGNPASGQ